MVVGTIKLPEAVSTTKVKGIPSRVIYRVYWRESVRWRGIVKEVEGLIRVDRWLSLDVRNEKVIFERNKRAKSDFISKFIKEILNE